MANEISFRRATIADREHIRRFHELTDLWRDVTAEHSEGFAADAARYVDAWTESDGGVICEASGEVVGGAWLRYFTSQAPGWGFVEEKYPEVAIALEPGWTGRGIGGKLMNEVIELAKSQGAPGVSLLVETGNERAGKSYKKVGFTNLGDDGEGGYTMLKTW